MKAIVFEEAGSACILKEIDKPKVQRNEVLVKIKYSSLNRRDFWIQKGIYQGAKFPCIVGSDAAGIVEEVGSEADKRMLNLPVLINPAINWGDNPNYHSDAFHIIGLPSQGTLAEYIAVPRENVFPLPEAWDFQYAAALPLAGLTAYRALFTRGALQEGEKVLITGAGGGVSSFLIQFAQASKAQVFVTSSSTDKIDTAKKMGVVDGALYNDETWVEQLMSKSEGGFHLIIDSAAGKNFDALLGLLKTGGRIVNFGGTAGKIPALTAAKIFWRQASILGTTMGSPLDFKNMLDFVEKNDLKPIIDQVFPYHNTEEAFQRMENHGQFGKIVIQW